MAWLTAAGQLKTLGPNIYELGLGPILCAAGECSSLALNICMASILPSQRISGCFISCFLMQSTKTAGSFKRNGTHTQSLVKIHTTRAQRFVKWVQKDGNAHYFYS